MRVGLIACSRGKLAHEAPAAELYTGDLFKLSRAWMTKSRRVNEWAILSGLHGLVMPDDVLAPYDFALREQPHEAQQRWAARTGAMITARWGTDVIYTVLAGDVYRMALRSLPLVEDVISDWTRQRRESGMAGRKAVIGIGVLKRLLREGKSYG